MLDVRKQRKMKVDFSSEQNIFIKVEAAVHNGDPHPVFLSPN